MMEIFERGYLMFLVGGNSMQGFTSWNLGLLRLQQLWQ
jgi:hypothetical protein